MSRVEDEPRATDVSERDGLEEALTRCQTLLGRGALGEAAACLADCELRLRRSGVSRRVDPTPYLWLLLLAAELAYLSHLRKEADLDELHVALSTLTRRIEDARRTWPGSFDVMRLFGRLDAHERRIAVAYHLGRSREAADWTERTRSRRLLDLLLNVPLPATPVSPREAEAGTGEPPLQQFRRGLLQARHLRERWRSGPAEQEDLARGLSDVYRQRVEQQRVLSRSNPHLAGFWGITPTRCRDLELLLDRHPGLAVVHYSVCEERVLVFCSTADGLAANHHEIRREHLHEEIARYRRRASQEAACGAGADKELERSSRRLYEVLLGPVESQLEACRRLCVVPHGALHYLPFGALRTPRHRYLMEEKEVFHAASLSLFDWSHSRALPPYRGTVVSFADPDQGDPGWQLPLASEQARSVTRRHPQVKLFLGSSATKGAFWTHAPRADVLALDMHNCVDRRLPLRTALRFAGADGALSVGEIYQRGSGILPGRLVVAAVCDGNVGEQVGESAEDELTTLARALHYAGFPSVLTSLWPVDDFATWLLMEAFYDHLLGSGAESGMLKVGEALRAAQLTMMRWTGREVLERCLEQRKRAVAEDPTGRRAAWIDRLAIARIEERCGHLRAAETTLSRAQSVFERIGDPIARVPARPPVTEVPRGDRKPSYQHPIFAHPTYWGAFVLLGRWSC